MAQRIRLNRTKLKGMQDTSTDYEELANSIQAGYFIKNSIANYNEDLFYLSVFITVSAQTYEELLWRKRQMTDMLKSMDMQVSECNFQQEAALRSVLPFLQCNPGLEKKSRRNILTSGAASTYGRAIINNSKNKIILNLEPDEARTVQETLKLTRSEVRAITQFERGEALICSNSNKVPVVIKASQTELEMITTDRAELEALLLERKKTRKGGKAHKTEKTQKGEVNISPQT